MPPYGAKAKEWGIEEVQEFLKLNDFTQYQQTFAENFINGPRLLKMGCHTLPQLGVRRFDHIKRLWTKIKKIIKVANNYDAEQNDPEKRAHGSATRIQSLARGKLDRRRVEEVKKERADKEREAYLRMQQEQYQERERAAILIQQRGRGMLERAKVKKMQEAGQCPAQLRAAEQEKSAEENSAEEKPREEEEGEEAPRQEEAPEQPTEDGGAAQGEEEGEQGGAEAEAAAEEGEGKPTTPGSVFSNKERPQSAELGGDEIPAVTSLGAHPVEDIVGMDAAGEEESLPGAGAVSDEEV